MLNVESKNYLINLVSDILKIKSYSGEEKKLVEKLISVFKDLHYDEVLVDDYGNITAKIIGLKPGKKILFDAHMDTVVVPEPGKWEHPPFGGAIEAGKIFGRGASDMKGAFCAMIVAASEFGKAVSKNFSGEVIVSGIVHEESFEGIAARRISSTINPDFVVIGEASELNLKHGQRGRAEIVVETFGKPAHSANPQMGINAVYAMTKLIEQIKTIELNHDPILGKAILELTDIKSSPYPGASVVPDYCRATYDRRLLVGETKEDILKPIESCIAYLKESNPQFEAKVSLAFGKEKCYTGIEIEGERFFPAWITDKNGDYVQKALNGLKNAGLTPSITAYSFCTNGSHYAGEAGIPTIGFGPSRENLAHTIDEYIEIDQLVAACNGYMGIMESLLT